MYNKDQNNLVRGEITAHFYSPGASIELVAWLQFATACFSCQ